MARSTPAHPQVAPQNEWLAARRELLAKEKELTHAREALSAERRKLPWVNVEKEYVFETPEGERTLADLFDGRGQLIVYHFMFGPGWTEGCPGCSFVADHIDGANLHLAHHDVTLLAVSRAPLAEFLPFKQRMGWNFKWVSSHGSDFNFDFGVSFTNESMARGQNSYNFRERKSKDETENPGLSVFYKDENGDIFQTYSTYTRGLDILLGTHNFLDLTPKGRNEQSTMDWVRHHDKYENAAVDASSCCHAESASA